MKKGLFTLLVLGSIVFSYAQKKPSINKAKSMFDKGDYIGAKDMIDQAVEYEKTKGKAKTWYYRGIIYAALDTATNEEGALEVSVQSFDKALELDPEQKTLNEFTGVGIENVDSRRNGYYAHYFNKAITFYNEKNFKSAATNFSNAFFINPKDTNAIVNAAYSYAAIPDDKIAEQKFAEAIKAGVKERTAYLQLYNYQVKGQRYDEALETIRKAKKIYPTDGDIAKYEINLLIQAGKVDDAIKELETALAKDPDNADYHFNMGVLKEETKDLEAAKLSYKRATQIDANHYNSNYNLGALIFNEASSIMKERNQLGMKEKVKSDELKKRADLRFKEALPIWEKIDELQPNDMRTLETLQYLYGMLGMKEKQESVGKKLETLK